MREKYERVHTGGNSLYSTALATNSQEGNPERFYTDAHRKNTLKTSHPLFRALFSPVLCSLNSAYNLALSLHQQSCERFTLTLPHWAHQTAPVGCPYFLLPLLYQKGESLELSQAYHLP